MMELFLLVMMLHYVAKWATRPRVPAQPADPRPAWAVTVKQGRQTIVHTFHAPTEGEAVGAALRAKIDYAKIVDVTRVH